MEEQTNKQEAEQHTLKVDCPLSEENIDEQGNVLYLDKERLKRKEVGFPPFKNRSNGLGIYNFLKEHLIYMSDKR